MKVELKSITKDDEPFLYEVYASSRRKEIDYGDGLLKKYSAFLKCSGAHSKPHIDNNFHTQAIVLLLQMSNMLEDC